MASRSSPWRFRGCRVFDDLADPRSTFGELAGFSARAHHLRRFLNSGPLHGFTGPKPTLPVIDVEHGGIGLLEEPLQDLDESGGLL
jgi:hypothetical protein